MCFGTKLWTAGSWSFPALITMAGWLRHRDVISDRRVRAFLIVQQGDGTPTGPRFESFYIRGTLGLGGLSIPMGLVDKGSVFRSSLSGSMSCRLLEVPVWMLDRTLSARWLALPIAYADFACLLALAKLLEEAGTPSQGADMSAALISRETSRGDVHATPVYDISIRSVLDHTQPHTSAVTMADVPGRNTLTGADCTQREAARRTRQRQERLPVEGGRS